MYPLSIFLKGNRGWAKEYYTGSERDLHCTYMSSYTKLVSVKTSVTRLIRGERNNKVSILYSLVTPNEMYPSS